MTGIKTSCCSKTPIYRGVWGKGNIRGKSGFCKALFGGKELATIYRGFVKPYLGERSWPRYIGVCDAFEGWQDLAFGFRNNHFQYGVIKVAAFNETARRVKIIKLESGRVVWLTGEIMQQR